MDQSHSSQIVCGYDPFSPSQCLCLHGVPSTPPRRLKHALPVHGENAGQHKASARRITITLIDDGGWKMNVWSSSRSCGRAGLGLVAPRNPYRVRCDCLMMPVGFHLSFGGEGWGEELDDDSMVTWW